MRQLNAFLFLSLNGYYKGPREDTSWHQHGQEESRFSEEQLKADNILLFGRKTYEMMYDFWPTEIAGELFPKVAERMNQSEKIVFSNTLLKVKWQNSHLLKGDPIQIVKKLKASKGKNLTILGSGSIVSLLTDAKLIDEYQFMIDPIVLQKGTSLFKGLKKNLKLKLIDTRNFKSSAVLLTYKI